VRDELADGVSELPVGPIFTGGMCEVLADDVLELPEGPIFTGTMRGVS
jgi:hypothetical protein